MGVSKFDGNPHSTLAIIGPILSFMQANLSTEAKDLLKRIASNKGRALRVYTDETAAASELETAGLVVEARWSQYRLTTAGESATKPKLCPVCQDGACQTKSLKCGK